MTDKVEIQEIGNALHELRQLTEKGLADKSYYQQTVEKLNKRLDAAEEIQQKALAEKAKEENARLELEERLTGIDKKLSRMKGVNQEAVGEIERHKKLFSELLQIGHKELVIADNFKEINDLYLNKKTLSTDSNTAGGYLVPTEFDAQIVKQITELSPVRQVARVRSTTGRELEVPVRTANVTAGFRAERSARPKSEQSYGLVRIPVNCLDVDVPITTKMLKSAVFNMEAEIFTDCAEAMAAVEGNKFLNGTGVEQPLGILVSDKVGTYQALNTSNAAGKFDADDLIMLSGQLKKGYNPMFMLPRGTAAYVRTLKSTDGQYLMAAGGDGRLTNGLALTINGYGYVVAGNDDMVAHTVSSGKGVIFGDFMRGYTIADGIGMEVLRDDYSESANRIVVFRFSREVGGGVVLPEALVTLTNKA